MRISGVEPSSYKGVCPPKIGYIVTVLPENWLYGSISIEDWL